jgi:hypothetical protein
VEWAVRANGSLAAKTDFDNLVEEDRAKVFSLFRRLADSGAISNREKFKNLGSQGAHLWEFKAFQDRFIGDFRPGKRFLVAAYTRKKRDKLDPAVITRAAAVLAANDRYERSSRS